MNELEKKLDEMIKALTQASFAPIASTRPEIFQGDFMQILPFTEADNPFADCDIPLEEAKKYIGKIVKVEYFFVEGESNRVNLIEASLLTEKYTGRAAEIHGDHHVCAQFYPFQLRLLPSYTGNEDALE